MIGKIIEIINGGTIVQLLVETRKGIENVMFDHRPFSWMCEGENGNLIGRRISFDRNAVMFLDKEND